MRIRLHFVLAHRTGGDNQTQDLQQKIMDAILQLKVLEAQNDGTNIVTGQDKAFHTPNVKES